MPTDRWTNARLDTNRTKFFYLHYTEKELLIARCRQHEQTEEFRVKYRWLAGVKATMNQFYRVTRVKRLRRVRG